VRDLLVPLLLALGLGCGSSAPSADDGGPCGGGGWVILSEGTLTVSPTAYVFADTAVGAESAPAKFTVSNIGCHDTGPVSQAIDNSTELVITGSTCGPPLRYQASCEVVVLFRPLAAGRKSVRMTVTAGPTQTFIVLLQADAYAPRPDAGADVAGRADAQPPGDAPLDSIFDQTTLAVRPAAFTFPATPVGQQSAFASFEVQNLGIQPSGPVSQVIDSGDFAITGSLCGPPLLAGERCALEIAFRPTAIGNKLGRLTVMTGPGLSVQALLLGTGTASPGHLTLGPAGHFFGTVPVGGKSVLAFDVGNDGGGAVGVVAIALEGTNASEFSAALDSSCVLPLEPGASCPVVATFAPTSAGPKAARLRATASPGGTITANLTGSGM